MAEFFLTVAVCTHNHLDALRQTLRNIHQLRPPHGGWEFLVVDNSSTDGTAPWLADNNWQRQDVECRVVQEPALGVAHARNRALKEARSDYVLFLDDDESPDPEWLSEMAGVLQQHQPAAAGGRICAAIAGGKPSWLSEELLGFLGELDYGNQISRLTDPSTPIFTGNAAFHKATALNIGGFDINLGRRGKQQTGGEDTELYRRIIAKNLEVVWVPNAIIHHRIEPWKLRRRYFLDLHFRQGRIEGARTRGSASRLPPKYLIPQVARAYTRALAKRLGEGADHSLRLEMNAAYFTGYLVGWMRDSA